MASFIDLVKNATPVSMVPQKTVLLTKEELEEIFGEKIDYQYIISECDSKILIFNAFDKEAAHLNGTVIDHQKKVVILRPNVTVNGGTDLPEVFPEGTEFIFPSDNTILRVFKYEGRTYIATTRQLNLVAKPGCPDYKKLYSENKGPSDEELFGEEKTGSHSYFFCLQTKETSLSMKHFEQKLYCVGYKRLEVNKTEEVNPLYTNLPNQSITEAHARALFAGTIDGKEDSTYPEFVVSVFNGVATKYVSKDYEWRNKVRGSTADTTTRFLDLLVSLKITDAGFQFDGEDFDPLPMQLVTEKHTSSLLSFEKKLVLCKYPGVPRRYVVPEGTFKEYEVIPIVSSSLKTYKTGTTNYFYDLIRCVDMHMRCAISPSKYEDLEGVRNGVVRAFENTISYCDDQLVPDREEMRVQYQPAPLPGGYVPTFPTQTVRSLIDHVKGCRATNLAAAVASFLCDTDKINFFHIMKYFASMDIRPPKRITFEKEEVVKKPYDSSRKSYERKPHQKPAPRNAAKKTAAPSSKYAKK